MRRFSFAFVVAVLSALSANATPRQPERGVRAPIDRKRAHETLAAASFVFEKNAGQFASDVDFISRGEDQVVLLNGSGARIALGAEGSTPAVVDLRFAGSRCDIEPLGGEIASRSNYFYGSDRSKWLTGVPTYRSVRYPDLYPGIDLEYHTRRGALEYDLIVGPGADWRAIVVTFDGASPRIDAAGNLVLKAGDREIRHGAPLVWQNKAGKRKEIRSRYEIAGNRVSFALGKYDPSLPLVIDPVLEFSRTVFPLVRYETFPGYLQVDASGNIYYSASVWGPTVKAAIPAPAFGRVNVVASKWDILLAKFNPDATQLLWTTYIGGGEADFVTGMAIDASADLYVVAQCGSSDFPTTPGVLGEYAKPSLGGRASVTKIDGTNGLLKYSTYIEDRKQGSGSHAQASGIAVDSQGNAIVIGSANAPTFPTTPNAPYRTYTDFGGFLSKLSPDGSSLIFSTYIPYTNPTTVAVAPDGNIFAGGPLIAGQTDQFDATVGTTPGVYQPAYIVGRFGWIMKFGPTGNKIFSTYYPMVIDMQVDSQGNLVTVAHASTPMPTFSSSYQKQPSGGKDVWIGKLSANGTTLLASTFYGGSNNEDFELNLDLGPNDSVYILGSTASANLPVASPIQGEHSGNFDFDREGFIAKFDTNLSTLLFSTYFGHVSLFGGLAVDTAGNPIFSGDRNPWPKGPQPFQATVPRFYRPDGPFIAKINMSGTQSLSLDSINPPTTPLTTEVQPDFIVLRGSGFQNGVRVTFGTTTVNSGPDLQVFGGGTEIWVKPPGHAAGKVNVTVTNLDATSATIANGFEYGVPFANITAATPDTVNTLGETVTFTGTDFHSIPFLSGAHGCCGSRTPLRNVNVTSPTQMTATSPVISQVDFQRDDSTVEVYFEPDYTKKFILNVVHAPKPAISSIQPGTVSTNGGETITINGANFHPDARVIIGDIYSKSVTFVNANKLEAVAPPNSGGNVTVIVINPDDGASDPTPGLAFQGLSSISPRLGPKAGGTNVTITGFGFTPSVTVTIGGVAASVTFVDSTTITATTPAHAVGSVDVSASFSGNTYVLKGAYTYLENPPTLTSLNPTFGPDTGGTNVTVNGTNFQSGAEVFFGGVRATTVTFNSAARLTARTASHPAGIVDLIVTNPDTQSVTSSSTQRFTYRGITSILPVEGSPGTSITITGGGFATGATVTLGGTAATGVTIGADGTTITLTVPDHAPGQVNVVVTNPTPPGGTFTKTNGFRILPAPPTITSFAPLRAGIGRSVTINGTSFTGATAVKFNSADASFTVTSDTAIQATVPNSATDGPIAVTTPSGTATSSQSFVVAPIPTITSFTPEKGASGTAVQIVGLNFLGATAVKFNDVSATFSIVDNTKINATVPANTTNGPISVTTPEGTGTSAAFFYLAPLISSYAPSSGAPGSTVTINGNNFLGTSSVTFNGTAATFTVNSQEKITATVPAAATSGPLTVTTPFGSVSSTFSFTISSASTPIVTATATGATTVALVWTGNSAAQYDVRRVATKTGNFSTSTIVRVTGTSYVDTTAAENTTYLYNIQNVGTGAIGNSDYATTVVFTNDPIAAGSTTFKAAHLTQLRLAVNAMRVAAQLTPISWTDPTLTGVKVKAAHITQLRNGLTEAMVGLGRYVQFTDASLSSGMVIRAAHIREIREAVK